MTDAFNNQTASTLEHRLVQGFPAQFPMETSEYERNNNTYVSIRANNHMKTGIQPTDGKTFVYITNTLSDIA